MCDRCKDRLKKLIPHAEIHQSDVFSKSLATRMLQIQRDNIDKTLKNLSNTDDVEVNLREMLSFLAGTLISCEYNFKTATIWLERELKRKGSNN